MPLWYPSFQTQTMENLLNKKRVKQANVLELLPVRLREHELDEEGLVTVLIPRTQSRFMLSVMTRMKRSHHFTFQLDRMGSVVWQAVDGVRSVEEICRQIEKDSEEQLEQFCQRVIRFLSGLYHGKHIGFKERV